MEPLAEIPEAEATGAIAELYNRIRRDSGSRVVNYVWRHLATIEGAADWCWQIAVGSDLSGPGAVLVAKLEGSAGSIAERLPVPGFDEGAREILAVYNRNNAANLLRISAALAAANDPARIVARAQHRASGSALPTVAAEPPLPPLPGFGAMRPADRAVLNRLAVAGPAAGSGVPPSLWRHLSAAPGRLQRIEPAAAAVLADPEFRQEWRGLYREAAAAVAPHGPPLPEGIDLRAVQVALTRFQGRIAEMALVGTILLRRAEVGS